jgi:chromosome segregation ATPase
VEEDPYVPDIEPAQSQQPTAPQNIQQQPVRPQPQTHAPQVSPEYPQRRVFTNHNLNSRTLADVESMKTQIASLESALELQERTLAAKASLAVNVKLPQEASNCFPYLQMLQLWRKKTLATVVKCTTAEKQLAQATHSFQRDRHILKQAVTENKAEALKWEERYSALVTKAEKQSVQVNELKTAWQREHEQRTDADAKIRTMESSLRQLEKVLRQYKSSFDEEFVRAQVINVKVWIT